MLHVYLFFDEAVPRPELREHPLPQGQALLMGLYEARTDAERHLERLREQIAAALPPGAGACGSAHTEPRPSE